MVSNILNGIILFFVIGVGSIFLFHQHTISIVIISSDSIAKQAVFVDYTQCKKVERPPQKYNGLDIGQGYDCMD